MCLAVTRKLGLDCRLVHARTHPHGRIPPGHDRCGPLHSVAHGRQSVLRRRTLRAGRLDRTRFPGAGFPFPPGRGGGTCRFRDLSGCPRLHRPGRPAVRAGCIMPFPRPRPAAFTLFRGGPALRPRPRPAPAPLRAAGGPILPQPVGNQRPAKTPSARPRHGCACLRIS